MLSGSRARCIKVAETCAQIEDLNEGLRVVRTQFHDTAATLALTCGTNDRDHNEVLYLQQTLAMVDSLLAKDTHGFEVVVVVRSRRRRE